MNKINFKEKKYVMPLLALPFLLLFVYVGAQFTKEDPSKKDRPKGATKRRQPENRIPVQPIPRTKKRPVAPESIYPKITTQ